MRSLQEVCIGLASCGSPLKQLVRSVTPKRSTLAYANEKRPGELYQEMFHQMLGKCPAEVAARGGRKKFQFKNKLMGPDGSTIDLSATVYDRAKYRRTKGAIKRHLLLDHDGYLPSFAVVTVGIHSEIEVARGLRLEAGTILAIDRGHNNYKWALWRNLWVKGADENLSPPAQRGKGPAPAQRLDHRLLAVASQLKRTAAAKAKKRGKTGQSSSLCW